MLQVKGPFLCYVILQQVSLRCSFPETFYLLLATLQTPSELHKSKWQSCGGQCESTQEESSLVQSGLLLDQWVGHCEPDHLFYICTTTCSLVLVLSSQSSCIPFPKGHNEKWWVTGHVRTSWSYRFLSAISCLANLAKTCPMCSALWRNKKSVIALIYSY